MPSLNNIFKPARDDHVLQMDCLKTLEAPVQKFWGYENWRAHGHQVTVHDATTMEKAAAEGHILTTASGTHSEHSPHLATLWTALDELCA